MSIIILVMVLMLITIVALSSQLKVPLRLIQACFNLFFDGFDFHNQGLTLLAALFIQPISARLFLQLALIISSRSPLYVIL